MNTKKLLALVLALALAMVLCALPVVYAIDDPSLVVGDRPGTFIYGDANEDGKVSNIDAVRILQERAGWDVTIDEFAADANADGKVSNIDAVRILQYLAGWNVTLGPEVNQGPEEEKEYKILMIGQSLAQDTVWLLYDVLKAEMPNREFVVGDVYKSTNLDEHVINIMNNSDVYTYYEWSAEGREKVSEAYTIGDALIRNDWDLIIFNDATFDTTQPKQFEDGDHAFMINYIRETVAETAAPGYQLAYNATWAKPQTRELHSDDNWEHFMTHFDGDRDLYYSRTCENIKEYIETNDEFALVFHPGTAIQYATETHGVMETDLYRDHIHLADFGRLLAAYQVYAQIFELEELTQVNVAEIKQIDRFTNDTHKPTNDLVITKNYRDAIIASVNYALENPNEIPPQEPQS